MIFAQPLVFWRQSGDFARLCLKDWQSCVEYWQCLSILKAALSILKAWTWQIAGLQVFYCQGSLSFFCPLGCPKSDDSETLCVSPSHFSCDPKRHLKPNPSSNTEIEHPKHVSTTRTSLFQRLCLSIFKAQVWQKIAVFTYSIVKAACPFSVPWECQNSWLRMTPSHYCGTPTRHPNRANPVFANLPKSMSPSQLYETHSINSLSLSIVEAIHGENFGFSSCWFGRFASPNVVQNDMKSYTKS